MAECSSLMPAQQQQQQQSRDLDKDEDAIAERGGRLEGDMAGAAGARGLERQQRVQLLRGPGPGGARTEERLALASNGKGFVAASQSEQQQRSASVATEAVSMESLGSSAPAVRPTSIAARRAARRGLPKVDTAVMSFVHKEDERIPPSLVEDEYGCATARVVDDALAASSELVADASSTTRSLSLSPTAIISHDDERAGIASKGSLGAHPDDGGGDNDEQDVPLGAGSAELSRTSTNSSTIATMGETSVVPSPTTLHYPSFSATLPSTHHAHHRVSVHHLSLTGALASAVVDDSLPRRVSDPPSMPASTSEVTHQLSLIDARQPPAATTVTRSKSLMEREPSAERRQRRQPEASAPPPPPSQQSTTKEAASHHVTAQQHRQQHQHHHHPQQQQQHHQRAASGHPTSPKPHSHAYVPAFPSPLSAPLAPDASDSDRARHHQHHRSQHYIAAEPPEFPFPASPTMPPSTRQAHHHFSNSSSTASEATTSSARPRTLSGTSALDPSTTTAHSSHFALASPKRRSTSGIAEQMAAYISTTTSQSGGASPLAPARSGTFPSMTTGGGVSHRISLDERYLRSGAGGTGVVATGIQDVSSLASLAMRDAGVFGALSSRRAHAAISRDASPSSSGSNHGAHVASGEMMDAEMSLMSLEDSSSHAAHGATAFGTTGSSPHQRSGIPAHAGALYGGAGAFAALPENHFGRSAGTSGGPAGPADDAKRAVGNEELMGSGGGHYGPATRRKIAEILHALVPLVPLSGAPAEQISIVEYGALNSRSASLVAPVIAQLAQRHAETRRSAGHGVSEDTAPFFNVMHADRLQADFRQLSQQLQSYPDSYMNAQWQSSLSPPLDNRVFSSFSSRPFPARVLPAQSCSVGFSIMDLHWFNTPRSVRTAPASVAHGELMAFLGARAQEFKTGGLLTLAFVTRSEAANHRDSVIDAVGSSQQPRGLGQSGTHSSPTTPSMDPPLPVPPSLSARDRSTSTPSVPQVTWLGESRTKDIWTILSNILSRAIQVLVSTDCIKPAIARQLLPLPIHPRTARQTKNVLSAMRHSWKLEWSCGLGELPSPTTPTVDQTFMNKLDEPPLRLPVVEPTLVLAHPAWRGLEHNTISQASYGEQTLQLLRVFYESEMRNTLREVGKLSHGATEMLLSMIFDAAREKIDEEGPQPLELEVAVVALRRVGPTTNDNSTTPTRSSATS